MTYSAGSLIVASDYNGFAAGNANNINFIWGTGSGTTGYGQSTTLSNVAAAGTITATQWASLNSRITSMANHQGTTITSRANPVVGNTIAILANLQTDINTLTLNHGNAALVGTQYTSWTGTSNQLGNIAIQNGQTFTINFRHDVTFANTEAARFFFNSGGLIKWQCSKTSTGQAADVEWNSLATTETGAVYITTGNYTQRIAGQNYGGTTVVGGTGTPSIYTNTYGFNQYTTANTTIYQQYSNVYGYTQNYISINANVNSNSSPTVLTLWTTWYGAQNDSFHPTGNITGGTATSGITFGTAPATVVTYFPPETTYLTEAPWGTPTVSATTSNTVTSKYDTTYVLVSGGGGGGSGISGSGGGGGGAGGYLSGTLTVVKGITYTITVGAAGASSFGNPGGGGGVTRVNASALQPTPLLLAQAGGGGGGGTGITAVNGRSGGSGGGGGCSAYNYYDGGGVGGLGSGGTIGNNGGSSQYFDNANYTGGGGGGASGAGGGGPNGAGGNGTASSITGASVTRAGGGGGSQGGGAGSGGATAGSSANVAAATTNTGSGGGGSSHVPYNFDPYINNIGIGGGGGSGIFILAIPTASYAGNSNVTGTYSYSSVSGNIVLQFTGSGTYIG
jgi:hypothetical protein